MRDICFSFFDLVSFGSCGILTYATSIVWGFFIFGYIDVYWFVVLLYIKEGCLLNI